MINDERLLSTFLSLVQIDSPSGREEAIREELIRRLSVMGLELQVDDTGNLYALQWKG